MSRTSAEVSTGRVRPTCAGDLLHLEPCQRLPGRNRTKADVLRYSTSAGDVAVKDYGARAWPIRETLGRFLTRRETAAYRAAGEVAGLPAFLGRISPYAIATTWIDAPRLAEFADGSVSAERFDRLQAILDALHARGVALGDLGHRDVLLAPDGGVHLVDLAMACRLGPRPGALRRAWFGRFRAADDFACARLRARFSGSDRGEAVARADPRAVAWHPRARRVKWCWDRLRGAPRLPPVDDHWRF